MTRKGSTFRVGSMRTGKKIPSLTTFVIVLLYSSAALFSHISSKEIYTRILAFNKVTIIKARQTRIARQSADNALKCQVRSPRREKKGLGSTLRDPFCCQVLITTRDFDLCYFAEQQTNQPTSACTTCMHNYEAAGARARLLGAIKRERERSKYCQLVARIVILAWDRG